MNRTSKINHQMQRIDDVLISPPTLITEPKKLGTYDYNGSLKTFWETDREMLIGLFFALVLVAPLDLALAARVSEAPQIERSQNGIKYTLEAQVDRVGYLPGWGELETFDMFSGLVRVQHCIMYNPRG